MGEVKLKKCRRCGHVFLASHISKRGLCPTCGIQAIQEAVEQLKKKQGPVYEKWRQAYERSRELRLQRLREFHQERRGKPRLPELDKVVVDMRIMPREEAKKK